MNNESKAEPKAVAIKPKPKRKCTEKQLAALAEGRKRNPRYIAKQEREAKAKQEREAKAKQETIKENDS